MFIQGGNIPCLHTHTHTADVPTVIPEQEEGIIVIQETGRGGGMTIGKGRGTD